MDPSNVWVLAVEDDEFTRIATMEILRGCRYNVDLAEDGQQASEMMLAKEGCYDLILCDVSMPRMNGIQLLEWMSSNEKLKHIPVVMTSSNEEMNVVTACLNLGAKDYLIKPIYVNTAKTLIRHVWLSQRQKLRGESEALWRNFDVIRTIGKGTHGSVVLVKRKSDGAIVALKQVRTDIMAESGKRQAANEVSLLKSLYHINIVRFYDSFVDHGVLNIFMEYADDGNLRQAVKRRVDDNMRPFPEEQVMKWFAQMVLGVAYIHGKNVLHRDLKAQNIFLTRKGVLKIGDFGISRLLGNDLTASTAVGTPESMSPEICRGEIYGKKSDIWSLGCILYEITMLARPFEANSLPEMFNRICRGVYIPVAEIYSQELRLLIQLMLQVDPNKRPGIEDIYRFSFIQVHIQSFLNEHITEFQEALEQEGRLQQNARLVEKKSDVPLSLSTDPTQPNDLMRTALATVVAGIEIGNAKSTHELITQTVQLDWRDELAEKLRSIVTVSNRRAGFLTMYPNCVTGAEVIVALRSRGQSVDEAIDCVKQLIEAQALKIVSAENANVDLNSPKTFLRFQADEENCALNMKYIWREEANDPMLLCVAVRLLAGELIGRDAIPSPECPNEMGLYKDGISLEKLKILSYRVAELQKVDILSLSGPDRQTFFLNIHNTMAFHAFAEHGGVPKTVSEEVEFSKSVAYNIGGLVYSLDDICHGILRGNKKPPHALWGRQMDTRDPRLKFVPHTRDPRSLFALADLCASDGSVNMHLPVFQSGNTDTLLEEHTRRYCDSFVQIDRREKSVVLPQLLNVYGDDFGETEEKMMAWLSDYIKDCPHDLAEYHIQYYSG